jgi:serine/threonine protein kinase
MEPLSRSPGLPRPFGPRYVLLKELARGGMGRVFLGMVGGRVCALKTLHPDAADSGLVRRFLDEARLATQLSHPNLIYVSEAGSEEGTPYFAMEYLRGKNLHQVFHRCSERRKSIPLGLAFFIVKELLRGLSDLHGVEGLNLVHRDVAPSNIVLSYEGGIKIIDLGLAKWNERLSRTMVGDDEFGQRRYVSPEQRFGRPVDARSDIYSVGAIFWEMVTGRELKREPDASGKLPDIALPSQVIPTLPRQLDQLVMGALADDPVDRYQSAQEAMAKITPNMSAEYESTALQSFLAGLFGDEIRQEADEEKQLVSKAEDVAPKGNPLAAEGNPVPQVLVPDQQNSLKGDLPHPRIGRRLLLFGALTLLLVATGIWFVFSSRTTSGPREPVIPEKPTIYHVSPPASLPDVGAPARPADVAPIVIAPKATSTARRIPRSSSARLLEEAKDLYHNQDLVGAARIAERLVESTGNDPDAHILLGDIYLKKGMSEKALTQYEVALKLDPNRTAAARGRDLARAKMR